jgi:putative nucleotidyltransferase with HDIG domain
MAPRQVVIVALALVTVVLTNPGEVGWTSGQVSTRTIRSDRDLVVTDPEATAEARLKAFNSATPLFALDDRLSLLLVDSLHRVFDLGRGLAASGLLSRPPARLEAEFCRLFPRDDCRELLNVVWAQGLPPELERQLAWLATDLMGRGILGSDPELASLSGHDVEIARAGQGALFAPFESVLTLEGASALIEARSRLTTGAPGEPDPRLLSALATALLRPNLVLDSAGLKSRRLEAAAAAREVLHRVRAGEIIVREGQTVTPLVELKLAALLEGGGRTRWLRRSLGLLVLLVVFMTATQTINRLDHDGGLGRKQLVLFSGLLLSFILLSWWSGDVSRKLATTLDYVEPHTVFMAMPIPAAAMLGAIFLGLRRTVMLCFLGSFLGSIVAPVETLTAFIYICNGCLVSNWRLKHISERARLIPASVMTALVNCLSLVGLTLFDGDLAGRQFLQDLQAACLSGLMSGILASGLVPLIEQVMGLTTNLKLMELGNLNRPILRDLMLAAPGTYHHSVVVGSMVEAAAEAIGANPHLARVGAYYHDIGKIKKPLYFIENQTGENKHETLTPTMSALVLTGHVKEGVDMAREHRLPRQVVDIVEQHHGTSLMSYFFHKAQECPGRAGQPINEGDFRYPGPKPASKEAGLVMLADICEAATRTLTDPTPLKIRDLVRTLVNRVFDDGQLDSSELILRDVTETIRVFTNILVGIYHHRIAYPGVTKEAAGRQAARSKAIYDHLDNGERRGRLTH